MEKTKSNAGLRKHSRFFAVCLVFQLLFAPLLHATIDIYAQKVTATFRNTTLNDVIWELQRQTDFTFIYSTADVQGVKVENVKADNENATDVLDKCLKNTNLTYDIHNGVVTIKKAESSPVAVAAPQQKAAVTGQVLDDTGEPMPGVHVVVKGAQTGDITGMDGHFSINTEQGQSVTLQFSYVGYATVEVQATPGNPVKIMMKEDTAVLDEVVVTGYGTFKKSAFAGSASTVKMTGKADIPVQDFKTLLQGSTPGVQINSASGAVGGSTSVTIRGLGSFNASTSPLYVVDGVPVMTSLASQNIDGGTDIMATLNTSDIENITVIKDAAAASLYGSRAANGVIVITTKSGKDGKAAFNFKADWGASQNATAYRPVMGGPERRQTFWEGLYNQAYYLNGQTAEEATQYANERIDEWAPEPKAGTALTEWVDWEKELFRARAPYENYEFSASGGDKRSSYYASLAYNNQDGIVRQQGLERITGRVNMKYKMTDKLQLGANVLYSRMKQLGSSEGGTYTSPIYSTRHKVSPSDHVFEQDGSYNVNLLENGKRNPKSQLDLNYKKQTVDRAFNTIFANYTLLDGLVFNTTFSIDHTNADYKSWSDPRSTDGSSDNGSLSNNFYQYDQLVWKNNLAYDTRIGEKHNVDALIGYETHEYIRKYISGSIKDFPNVEKHQISNGANITGLSGAGDTGWRLLSYLGTANYNYDHKYYIGASARVDGSSRLFKDSRWGTFWSASGAWRISSESFMEPVRNVLNDLRLRVSYGSNGTLPSDYYGYMDLVSFSYAYNTKPGLRESQIGNKNLKWEKNYNLNLALDFSLFDRINATVEYYNRTTSDLLMDMPLSMVTGFSKILTNIGEVKNNGIEVEINADILRGKDFTWNSALNIGHNKNKIVNLGDQEEIVGSYTIRKVGQPYYRYYVKEFAGIDPDDGYPLFYVNDPERPDDRTTTKKADEANYIIYKGPDPVISGGFNNTLKYKIIDLGFLWTFTLGGYSYDNGASKLEHGGKSEKGAIQTLYRDRWKQPGDRTDIEMFMVGNPYDMTSVVNSRRIHSSDHLRLKSLTLGVSLPKTIVNKARLQNIRFFFSGTNLLTFAAYGLYDPEIPADGIYYFEAPKMKTYTFGIDVKF
ncbi:MAG: TonB-dependent receptor [Tannerella sp.]|jgi:TonB-linked SusC/RagA family outer membrane protein|nr:TonB-dependent receptor [Tannerella sp.]